MRVPVFARRAALIATALMGCVCVAVLARGAFRPPLDAGLASLKRAHVDAHGDEYDTLFVGSSRVYRNIDPLRFDASMAEAGRPTRSFNLGLPGMEFLEALHTARALLDARPTRLRHLVLEILPAEAALFGNVRSARVRAWHDGRTTLDALRLLARDDDPLGARLNTSFLHVTLGLGTALRFGAGSAHVARWGGPSLDAEWTARAPAVLRGAGHLLLEEDDDPLVAARRERFLGETDRLRARTADFLARPGDEPEPASGLALLAELGGRAEAAGVRLVLLGMPVHRRFDAVRRAADDGRLPVDVILLSDARAHPELYDPSLRFDANHLDRHGTARLTDLLAAAMSAL